jgi:hypothetical protein
MQGARLEKVTLKHGRWGPVTYDRATRWPAGFDPRAFGAKLVE